MNTIELKPAAHVRAWRWLAKTKRRWFVRSAVLAVRRAYLRQLMRWADSDVAASAWEITCARQRLSGALLWRDQIRARLQLSEIGRE